MLKKVLYKVLSNGYNQDFTLPIHFRNTPYTATQQNIALCSWQCCLTLWHYRRQF